MITLDSLQFEKIVLTSAGLRADGNFEKAIQLMETMLPALADECLMNAYHELFLAHEELGNLEVAMYYANRAIDQGADTPAIRRKLNANSLEIQCH